jgi:hypothetical protein
MKVYYKCRQGDLTEGEGSVQLTSLFTKLRLAALYVENINLCYTTRYLNEEVNCTELSPSVSVS